MLNEFRVENIESIQVPSQRLTFDDVKSDTADEMVNCNVSTDISGYFSPHCGQNAFIPVDGLEYGDRLDSIFH